MELATTTSKKGDHVIVETARGIEYGTVVGDIREVEDDKVIQPLKPVLRIATERDDEQEAANKIKEKDAFISVTKGYGSFIDAKTEGIRKNNLYGTYLLGPFLIQNPLFTKYLMGKLGVENPQLAFEEEIMKAYDVRVKEFKTDIEFIG